MTNGHIANHAVERVGATVHSRPEAQTELSSLAEWSRKRFGRHHAPVHREIGSARLVSREGDAGLAAGGHDRRA
jgi:hypothetical protein